jgi:aldehyde dehydrogenase (NAD+)
VVRDADEAVEVANDSEYGLSAGIFAATEQQALEIAHRLDSGMVHVNDSSVYDEPSCPFGGCKASGVGRHGGRLAIDEFTETRWIGVQHTARTYPI